MSYFDQETIGMFKQISARIDARHEENIQREATHFHNVLCDRIGSQLATEQGLSGDAVTWFVHGFTGRDIKEMNPRRHGFEMEFRAGKTARKDHVASISRQARMQAAEVVGENRGGYREGSSKDY